VGALVPLNGTQKVSVFGEQDQTAGYFMANSDNVYGVGLFGRSDLSGGVVGNAGTTGDYYPSNETGVTGVADEGADAALFVAFGDGKGVWTQSEGAGDALRAYAGGTGRSGYFSGGTGVDMSLNNGDMVYPVLDITNYENSWYGDCLHLQSQPNVHAGTTTLRSHCYRGRAGHFEKDTAGDGYYAVTIYSPTVSSAGLYVFGYIYATSAMAREVETSRGKEAVFSMSSPEVEMVSSGQGRLSGGTARVDFDRTFAESITNPSDLRITATPVGGWSALYIDRIDADGFDLRSDSGRTDVGFHWVAIGRAEDYERKPEIVTPDHDEEMRIQQLKDEELRARRPPTERPKRPAVVSAQDG
jgi:hypothetical protein